MADNPWNQLGDSIPSVIDIRRLRLEKQKMAQEAVKQKFEMMQKNYQHAWEVIKDPDIPGAMKVNYWNHIVAPYDSNVMGVHTPEMTQWNDDLQNSMSKMANLVERAKNHEISISDLKMARLHLGAEVASNPKAAAAFAPIDSVIAELSGGAPTPLNVGGKTVQASKNIDGSYDPVQVNGMGAAVAPSQLSVEQGKNRQDAYQADLSKFQEVSKILTSSKEGTLDALFPRLSPEEREQAVREAHASLYIVGGHLGATAKQVTGIINGTLDTNKVLTDIGKKFAIDGGAPVTPDAAAPAPTQSLPGLRVIPRVAPQKAEVPPPSDAPQLSQAVQDPSQPNLTQTASTLPDDKGGMANV